MVVNDLRTPRKADTFKDIPVGEGFEFSGELYLKLSYSNDVRVRNALNIRTHALVRISPSDSVKLVKMEMTVKNWEK